MESRMMSRGPASILSASGAPSATSVAEDGKRPDLSTGGAVPVSCIPPAVVLEWRERVRLYKSLVDQRPRVDPADPCRVVPPWRRRPGSRDPFGGDTGLAVRRRRDVDAGG